MEVGAAVVDRKDGDRDVAFQCGSGVAALGGYVSPGGFRRYASVMVHGKGRAYGRIPLG